MNVAPEPAAVAPMHAAPPQRDMRMLNCARNCHGAPMRAALA
jgi:hypothetical protein